MPLIRIRTSRREEAVIVFKVQEVRDLRLRRSSLIIIAWTWFVPYYYKEGRKEEWLLDKDERTGMVAVSICISVSAV